MTVARRRLPALLTGLFGDGNRANDFRTRDGRLLATRPEFSVLYGTFAESWRVRPGESLFDYAPGESTDTFTDRSIPEGPATLADLPPADRARAEAACRGGGVTDPAILEDCIVDVGFSGDESFIASALDRQTPAVFVAPPDPMPEPIVSGLCRPAAAGAAAFSFRADAGRTARYPGALRRFEGEQQWSAQGFWPGHDPLAVGNRVLAARERGLAALDAETGQIAREVASPGGRIAGPGLLAAGGAVLAAWTDELASYDLEAGTEC